MPRAMGLDVGTLTIGVAISDELGLAAHRVCTVSRKGVRADCEVLAKLITERQVDRLVVGMPYELDGTEERSAKLARQVGEALSARTGLKVNYVDERFTSVDAERRLIAQGMSRAKRKEVIDQEAAAIILQGWLDHGVSVEEA
jgi:putative Holliday junction resolvase